MFFLFLSSFLKSSFPFLYTSDKTHESSLYLFCYLYSQNTLKEDPADSTGVQGTCRAQAASLTAREAMRWAL